ncbi:MAG: PIG-L deacetylase family protein [Myxococcota bacterium]
MATKVLVVAPHPDDESIGCGGTICLHRRRGDRVHAVFLTSGERGMRGLPEETARSVREAEAQRAAAVLGLERTDFMRLPDLELCEAVEAGAERLRVLLKAWPPDLVYLPHPEEAHPDHRACLSIVRRALDQLADGEGPAELRLYEVWSPMASYGWPEDISSFMRRKLRAVRCYRSQLDVFRYDRAVHGLNQYRGALMADCRFAEVFQYAEPR